MTLAEFTVEQKTHPCQDCGATGVVTEHNPNNNGLLVRCPNCGSKRPWGSLLYLKQNERARPKRSPLPDGQTLDSVWERYSNCCVMCSAPKHFLERVGIGRQVHHVMPHAQHEHRGPLVPVCTHCHAVASERQRLYWFYQRVVLGHMRGEPDTERLVSPAERGHARSA
jgi:predicted RNA-binding Zn-ribbon protein involved in translation (DUF1610 family)